MRIHCLKSLFVVFTFWSSFASAEGWSGWDPDRIDSEGWDVSRTLEELKAREQRPHNSQSQQPASQPWKSNRRLKINLDSSLTPTELQSLVHFFEALKKSAGADFQGSKKDVNGKLHYWFKASSKELYFSSFIDGEWGRVSFALSAQGLDQSNLLSLSKSLPAKWRSDSRLLELVQDVVQKRLKMIQDCQTTLSF